MASEKKLILTGVLEYLPPRLVKAKQGWYIIYYHQVGGKWVRERKTFLLNRIADKKRRMERAREIIEQIETGLSEPADNTAVPPINALKSTPVLEAIQFAANIQMQSTKKETIKSFKMIRDMLVRFIQKKKMSGLSIGEWGARHAQAFLDDAVQRGISNTTYNNYRGFSTILWNVLIKREYITVNPFHGIKKREAEEKTRRPFTQQEKAVVLEELQAKDYWLFMLVMLHFLCLIRRTECYRLRFSYFNLADGYISLPRTATKNHKASVVTIPDTLLNLLREEKFSRFPGNYLLFGAGGKPNPNKSAGENTFKHRHRELLLRLQKEKKLDDITGLSLYSWKDTGMTEFAKILRPIELRDHARHASIDQSLEYYHQDKIITGVKKSNF